MAGYKVYVGTTSGVYTRVLDAGNATSYAMTLPKGVTYFFAVTACLLAQSTGGGLSVVILGVPPSWMFRVVVVY